MRKLLVTSLTFLLVFIFTSPCLALNRDQLRAGWQEICSRRTDASPYLEIPDTDTCAAGALSDAAQADALDCLNFLRAVAGLDPVELSPVYTLRAQNGALLLAINDELDHNAPQPAGMQDEQYQSAHLGTSLGNIAKFNWMKNDILIDGVRYFARDDGAANLENLGHRRWLLNPQMAQTGFGLANAESGMSYVTMYAVDAGNADAQWEYVAWPAAGAFPVEMMRAELAWSVSINEEIYDLSASQIQIHMEEKSSGAQFDFDLMRSEGDGYCALSTENCGSGSCIIFRPDLENAGISEYVQNQLWFVCVSGLRNADGSPAEIRYQCEMVSLYPQEAVSVELTQLEAEIAPGETLQLEASVIPAYADDLSVVWGSSDPKVASVNPAGLVTGVATGECRITAMNANGKKDVCIVRVKQS